MTDLLETVSASGAVYDCSHWGRLRLTGGDRLKFLHNQSSNNCLVLQPGQGADTVFLTSTARTLDLVTLLVHMEWVDLLVSPQRREFLLKWLDKYIFFGDDVQVSDRTSDSYCYRVFGAVSDQIADQLGLQPFSQPYAHVTLTYENAPITIAATSGLAIPGLTLWSDRPLTDLLNAHLQLNDTDWEHLRIRQGRPAADAELTEDYNPLEARLGHTISFNKGCYIGQETIARLNTYQGVKQHLWGLELSAVVPAPTPLLLEGEKVGLLTSCTPLNGGAFGLGYVRTKVGGAGLTLHTPEGIIAQVVEVPFLRTVA
ncbi:folate-binding protein [Thermosynechococcus sp. PP22]|uniref:CAF17-like 4Fe-4S cluster assembly/insertion protein YgfZ n=1 Tax=unclassified Thermosynechococcus TaxID=2622553 RepID=UPI002575FE5D|nr:MULTISPECIES: folate-binding protein [unclassified Thermosynechococcus]WJI27277.1 folate-binding protein [Thermosynechococcus sp. B1]WNC21158.1 folate-binding protein [Thermosynechococcus sp. PP22]WNC51632.1 folate-binding protein [Thermosynechococcus sp. TG215]WNC56713.1 folate-binding protein [Thermosynechococcus sp. TG218]